MAPETTAATSYIVECFWPDVRDDQVERAGGAARSAQQLSGEGTAVAYTGSILVPEDEIVFFLFEGALPKPSREKGALARQRSHGSGSSSRSGRRLETKSERTSWPRGA